MHPNQHPYTIVTYLVLLPIVVVLAADTFCLLPGKIVLITPFLNQMSFKITILYFIKCENDFNNKKETLDCYKSICMG